MFDRVLKFGGTALADGPAVARACRLVRGKGGERPIVVVSAHRGVTDLLLSAAQAAAEGRVETERVRIGHRSILAQLGLNPELLDRYLAQLYQVLANAAARREVTPSELDFVLSFGERMSARVVAQALSASGTRATPVDAYDLGFTTDSNHGRARPLAGIGVAIRGAVAQVPGVAVVTGFLAKDKRGNLTTLGRDGSDLSAAVLAEAVGARELHFWKPVGGILTADPAIVPDARVIDRLSYAEAAECAFHGARILHPASVAPALRARVEVRLLDVTKPDAPGTLISLDAPRRGPIAVACRRNVARLDLALTEPSQRGERVAELFSTLDRHNVAHGLLSASGERATAIVEPGPGLAEAVDALGPGARVASDFAIVAVIGRGVGVDAPIGPTTHELLSEAGVDVAHAFLGDREESQSFLVAANDVVAAVRTLHGGLLAGTIRAQ